jgi:signal transduction histidine kinase
MLVAVPVRADGQCVGVLSAARQRVVRAMAVEWLTILEIVANQIGTILQSRELLSGNLSKIQQLLALQRISRQMTAAGEISALLQLVVDEALQLTGADAGALYLVAGAQAERLRLAAWAGNDPAPGREEVPLGYGIVGWVARSGTALRASDRGGGQEPAEYATRRSQLAVPLVSDGRVLGVLAVTGTREEAFTPTHEELLTIFAAQAAKAIEAGRFLRQVREERDLRDRILSGTPNGVIAVDGVRRVVLMNQAARRLLGVGEAPEGNPLERYLGAPRFLEKVRDVLAARSGLESAEFTVNTKNGPRQVLANIFPLEAQPGATVILQDLTERRKFDERVQRITRLASIGQLAAGIAHEIRNPLTGVAISLDILREEAGLSADGRSLLDDINREIDRLETLIRGLLDFARPQPPEFRPMRLVKALEWHRTFQEQCRQKGVELHVELRENPKIEGDPEKLKQLFLNLAINALEAVPSGGEIRIWTELLADPPRPWVRVWVDDDGPGMDERTLAQIFNPFFTTKSEGTGLGLSIVHSIVEQHGGRIDVQSRPNGGTRFVVDLPAVEEA